MTQQKGRAWLLKISDGAAGFTAFAGLTGKSLKINGERIDATVPDATTPEGIMWRQTLDGTKSISASGDGTLVEDASESRLLTIAMQSDSTDDFQIIIPGVGTFEGAFSVDVELGDNGAVTFSAALESNGPITFTAA